eukprot:m.242112 g.242112  ORF g.242112 m.242112 type:complete len:76 (-) comp26325_c0_seq9:85-312(-)
MLVWFFPCISLCRPRQTRWWFPRVPPCFETVCGCTQDVLVLSLLALSSPPCTKSGRDARVALASLTFTSVRLLVL